MGVSALTMAELHAGVRDGEERDQLAELLSIFNQIPVDPETAAEGGLLRRDFGPSHGTGLIDAILAATALKYGLRLVTLNDKHYATPRTNRDQSADNDRKASDPRHPYHGRAGAEKAGRRHDAGANY